MVLFVISLFNINPVERTPIALLLTTPAVLNTGRVVVVKEFPMVIAPVEFPVFMFVAKFELLFKLIIPPDIDVTPVIVAPADPVNNPAEVMVPVPEV